MTKKKKVPKKKYEFKKKPESIIYVGPMLPNLALTQFKIFRGLPDHLKKKCKENKHFDRVFVKRTGFAKAAQDLKNKNSIMSISYNEVAKGL